MVGPELAEDLKRRGGLAAAGRRRRSARAWSATAAARRRPGWCRTTWPSRIDLPGRLVRLGLARTGRAAPGSRARCRRPRSGSGTRRLASRASPSTLKHRELRVRRVLAAPDLLPPGQHPEVDDVEVVLGQPPLGDACRAPHLVGGGPLVLGKPPARSAGETASATASTMPGGSCLAADTWIRNANAFLREPAGEVMEGLLRVHGERVRREPRPAPVGTRLVFSLPGQPSVVVGQGQQRLRELRRHRHRQHGHRQDHGHPARGQRRVHGGPVVARQVERDGGVVVADARVRPGGRGDQLVPGDDRRVSRGRRRTARAAGPRRRRPRRGLR